MHKSTSRLNDELEFPITNSDAHIKQEEAEVAETDQRSISGADEQSSEEAIHQLACELKDALFSKYISNYLLRKAEEMWSLYEKRVDRTLQQHRFPVSCQQNRPETIIKLEELAKDQEKEISHYQRNLQTLCSARKRLRDASLKQTVKSQSTRPAGRFAQISSSSIRVPKTPRCIDRSTMNDEFDLEEHEYTNDGQRQLINQQRAVTQTIRPDFRHCRFEHGELLPIETNKTFRIIRIRYTCSNN